MTCIASRDQSDEDRHCMRGLNTSDHPVTWDGFCDVAEKIGAVSGGHRFDFANQGTYAV